VASRCVPAAARTVTATQVSRSAVSPIRTAAILFDDGILNSARRCQAARCRRPLLAGSRGTVRQIAPSSFRAVRRIHWAPAGSGWPCRSRSSGWPAANGDGRHRPASARKRDRSSPPIILFPFVVGGIIYWLARKIISRATTPVAWRFSERKVMALNIRQQFTAFKKFMSTVNKQS
jgi:hypothetical protein